MRDGFIKVAASTPEIRVADVDYNKELIAQGMDQAWKDGIQLLVYPSSVLPAIPAGIFSGRRNFWRRRAGGLQSL